MVWFRLRVMGVPFGLFGVNGTTAIPSRELTLFREWSMRGAPP